MTDCPSCGLPNPTPSTGCGGCGFSQRRVAEKLGSEPVVLEPIIDAAHCLRMKDRTRMEHALDEFHRRFPEVLVSFYFGVLPAGVHASEAALWLAEHGLREHPSGVQTARNALLLIVDPVAHTAALAVGRGLVSHLVSGSPLSWLKQAQLHLWHAEYAAASLGVIAALEKRLLRVCSSKRRKLSLTAETGLGVKAARRPKKPLRQHRSVEEKVGLLSVALLSAGLTIYSLGADKPGTSLEDRLMPLPSWSAADSTRISSQEEEPELGGALWPRHLIPELAAQTAPLEKSAADTGENEQPVVDISTFLPPRLGPRSDAALTPAKDAPQILSFVTEDYLAVCREIPADQHLLDPWHHLPETSGEELEQFLAYHSQSSSMRASVLVLGRDEQLSPGTDLSLLASGALKRPRTCLAVVPVAQPWRARIFLSQDVQAAVPPIYLANLAGDCVNDAAQAADETEQFHRFLVRLSTRLFWLERLLPQPASHSPVAQSATSTSSALSPAKDTSLTEVTELPQEGLSEVGKLLLAKLSSYREAAALALLGLLAFMSQRRWLSYKMRHYEWLLPESQPQQGIFGSSMLAEVTTLTYR